MKVDYDKLADTYDNHRGAGGPYLAVLLRLAEACRATRVLELGAGTGNNTGPFLRAYPSNLVALEPSQGMLAKARAKGFPAQWIRGSATRIPLADDSVDYVFGCYFLHYMPDLEVLFAECARVLDGGIAAFVTAPTDFIDTHPMNAYFPSFAAVDRARFQTADAIETAFNAVGFRDIALETVSAKPAPVDQDYVERVANQFISTYTLIPEDEFTQGLKRLRADVDRAGQLDTPIIWRALTVSARIG